MKNSFKKVIISSLLFLSIPTIAFSAQITAKHFISSNGNKNTVEVYLDTEGETINAVDGSITLDGFGKDIISISTGESPLSLWPNKPSLIDSKISFTGGVPQGLSGKDILLFVINLQPTVKEELTILPKDVYVYLNNGKGDTIKTSDRTIFMVKGDTYLESTTPNDVTPPKNFTVELGRDATAYEGKYFLSFFTTDEGSGITHYEVTEGDSNPVLADSPYILRDQTLQTKVEVKAYDNFGNTAIAKYVPEYKLPVKIKISIILIASLLLIGLFRISWLKMIALKRK